MIYVDCILVMLYLISTFHFKLFGELTRIASKPKWFLQSLGLHPVIWRPRSPVWNPIFFCWSQARFCPRKLRFHRLLPQARLERLMFIFSDWKMTHLMAFFNLPPPNVPPEIAGLFHRPQPVVDQPLSQVLNLKLLIQLHLVTHAAHAYYKIWCICAFRLPC